MYDRASTKAFCLNETAAAVWGMCDGKTMISEMPKRSASSFGGAIDDAFVSFALARFREHGLIESDSFATRPTAGVTRAELLSRAGRVGIATAVAVPLVTAIVAPTAAKAYGRQDDDGERDHRRSRRD